MQIGLFMDKVTTDVIRRVCNIEAGVCLQVGPDPESPRYLVKLDNGEGPDGDGSERHWGKVDLTLSKSMAKALGEALVAAADELIDF